MKSYREISEALESSTNEELDELIKLCIGRIFAMGSRPAREGDIDQYNQVTYLAKRANEELQQRQGAIK
jgi:NADPH-dependent 7-cyano-7-deazaguanine reductase QueF